MPATSRMADALAAALGQWARRLALEIDDDEILAGVEHLSQM